MIRAFEACVPRRVLLLATADALFIAAALLGTRMVVAHWLPAAGGGALLPVIIACGVVLICLYCYDLYEYRVATNPRIAASRLSQVLGTACVVLALLYYADPNVLLHRDVVLSATILIGTVLVINRRIFGVIHRAPGLGGRALVLGSGELAGVLAAEIARHPELGLRAVGYVGDASAAVPATPHLGGLDDLMQVAERTHADRVIVALGPERGRLPLQALIELRSRGIRVEDGPEAFEEVTAKVALDAVSLEWLLSLNPARPRASAVYQRLLSLAVAIVALVVALPLFAIIAAAVALDSPGPVVFRQPRIGQGGRPFTLYKFRSMTADADGSRPCQAGDSRITRVGRWLRRCRLDELPQLINIIRGDIAVVGPRPFVPAQEHELAAQIPFYSYRWTVKPGLTGWAQIHRGYCATLADNIDKLAYDLFYIKHRSLGLDLLIVFQTFKIMMLGRGAR